MQVFSTKGVNFPNGFPKVEKAVGSRIDLITSDERHMFPSSKPADPDRAGKSFADMLLTAVNDVEKLDVRSQELTTRSVYDPDSVEAHTIMIEAEKARFALNLTKTLADGFIRTFRELTNPR